MKRTQLCVLTGALGLMLSTGAVGADQVPVEAFAQRASFQDPQLSPDGQYLALNVENGDDHAVVIYKVDDMSHPSAYLRMPHMEMAGNYDWVGPRRLVVEKAKLYGSLDKPLMTGEILAVDVDGKHIDAVYSREENLAGRGGTQRNTDDGYATVAGLPAKANDHIYMQTYSWADNSGTMLYDVDTRTGVRHLLSQIGDNGFAFTVDSNGTARYAYGDNTKNEYALYQLGNGGWGSANASAQLGKFEPLTFSLDNQQLYVYATRKNEPRDLYVVNADGSQKLLAKDDFGDIGRLQWTAERRPFAATTTTGVPHPVYLDPQNILAQLHAALSAKFPNQFVDITSVSEDGSRFVFLVSSDRNPGDYYLFDRTHNSVRKLFQANPSIDPDKMAMRTPMRFKTSDGVELEAIITVPDGVKLDKLPMVLVPHGGPFDIADDWFFDTDAQFLASRGYLVLQVNYRGSGGRGTDFVRSGYGHWGDRIQQDLIDGVKWAEDQGFADPKRVCVYGASFGGYSALMTTIRAPGMFQCAIGYAGIYDLSMMYSKGDIRTSSLGKNYLHQAIGDDPAVLDANSPAKLAAQVSVPVFLVHGEADERAPFAQAKAMRAALEAAHKPYEWMSKPGEAHGFYTTDDNIDLYNHMQAFLEKYIGPGAKPN